MVGELISKLEAYINGSISRENLSIWFYDLSRSAEERYTGESLDFIHEIERIFAESSSGGWDAEGLKDELEAAIRNVPPAVYEFTQPGAQVR